MSSSAGAGEAPPARPPAFLAVAHLWHQGGCRGSGLVNTSQACRLGQDFLGFGFCRLSGVRLTPLAVSVRLV